MCIDLSISAILCVLLPLSGAGAEERSEIPDDFPRFIVPGHEKGMESLRALYFLHYKQDRPGGLRRHTPAFINCPSGRMAVSLLEAGRPRNLGMAFLTTKCSQRLA